MFERHILLYQTINLLAFICLEKILFLQSDLQYLYHSMRRMSYETCKIFLIFSVTFLVGCATGPKYMEVQSNIPPVEPEKGRIYFYRSANMFGSGIQPTVNLNGEKVSDSKPGGFFFVDRAPGDYEVVLSTEVDKKLTFPLDTGEEKYVRMTVGLGVIVYRVYPELIPRSDALKEIQELSYIGAPME